MDGWMGWKYLNAPLHSSAHNQDRKITLILVLPTLLNWRAELGKEAYWARRGASSECKRFAGSTFRSISFSALLVD